MNPFSEGSLLCKMLQLIFSVIGVLGMLGIGLLIPESKPCDPYVRQAELSDTGILVLIGSFVLTIVSFVSFFINLLLLVKANKRNWTMCKVWMILSAIGVALILFCMFDDLFPEFTAENGLKFTWILSQFYTVRIIWNYISEVQQERELTVAPPP